MNKQNIKEIAKSSKNETRIVVLSPDSNFTPETLAKQLITLPITVKTTCWGLILSGDSESIQQALHKIRPLDPNRIFTKIRGYPPGDPRICRFHRGGGPRPGFHFLEYETAILPFIGKALESLEEELVSVPEKILEKPPFSVKDLKKIINETEL